MTVRIYIFQTQKPPPCNCKWYPKACPCDNTTGKLKHAHAMATMKYGENNFSMGADENGKQALWLEFDSEESAALFKLTL